LGIRDVENENEAALELKTRDWMQVSSIYLFHELPGQARLDAVSEMARVLKPGGLLVFNDGTQLGDRPVNDATQGNFQAFNEPNWGTHIALDYGETPRNSVTYPPWALRLFRVSVYLQVPL
jgi:SAM-dependent methyltransferase